jgi:CheY-like chemotaxis protein
MSLVLVVDDSPTIRGVVTAILVGHGYETLTAEDGEAALVRLREHTVDLVLTDFVMPRMNGFQLCREMRMDQKLRPIPIVLMSAKGDKLRGQFVQASGAVDALTKPFDPLALVAVVENALARRATAGLPSLPPPSDPRNERPSDLGEGPTLPGNQAATGQELTRAVASAVAKLVVPALSRAPGVATSKDALGAVVEGAFTDAAIAELAKTFRAHSTEDSQAILSGDLSCISIPEVLQMLELQRQTGALHIAAQRTEIVLYLREGLLDFARGHGLSSTFRLGRYLVRAGVVGTERLRQFLDGEAVPNRLIGEAMVQLGVVSDAAVQDALRAQVSELVYEVVGWKQGRFTFARGGTCPEATLSPLGLQPGGIVMEGFRRVDEWRLIESTIDFDDTLLRDAGSEDKAVASELTEAERNVLDAIDGTRSVREIVDVVPASTFDVCKILYQFLNSRIVRRRAA